jgi:hypothetical protein
MSLEAGNVSYKTEKQRTSASTSIRVLHPPPAEPLPADSGPSGLRQRTTEQDSSSASTLPADVSTGQAASEALQDSADRHTPGHITFSPETYEKPVRGRALRIPGPREFERGISCPTLRTEPVVSDKSSC